VPFFTPAAGPGFAGRATSFVLDCGLTTHSLHHRNPIMIKSLVHGEVWHKVQKWNAGGFHEMLRKLFGEKSEEQILTFPSILGGKSLQGKISVL